MGAREPRISGPTLKVLKHFLVGNKDEQSGADISKATGVGAGTLYPMLGRLEDARWLESRWEEVDPKEAGRPRRRLYQMTGLGAMRTRAILAEFQINYGFGGAEWAR